MSLACSPGPTNPSGASPEYRRHGYTLRALGRTLALSARGREALTKLGLSQGTPAPDVVLRHTSGDHLILECKAQSFSTDSSTVLQAQKLLIACADPNEALGAAGSAYVAYVLPIEDIKMQKETLTTLAAELAENEIAHALHGTLGLEIDENGLWAHLSIDGLPTGSSAEPICGRVLAVAGSFNEARPIYLIPYDPAAENEQADSEREYCGRLLAERLFNQAISVIGRSELPECVHLASDRLLDEATFSISSHWEGRELHKFKVRIASFMYGALNRGQLRSKVELRGNLIVELNLADEEDRNIALSLLHRGDPADLSERLLDPQIDAAEQFDRPTFK